MFVRLALAIPALLAVACSGSDDAGVVPAPVCDGLETKPYGLVEITEHPVGTLDAVERLLGMDGRYSATDSCKGGPTFIKITSPAITREEVPLVIAPYNDGPCGCTEDAAYGADSDYPLVGVFEGASVFIEDGVEAGAQGSTVFVDTTLFGADAALSIRSCGSLVVDPYRQSIYADIEVVFRILSTGSFDGTYTLISPDETLECQLTDWVLIAAG